MKCRLSDATGKLILTKLDGPISKSKLDEKDGMQSSCCINYTPFFDSLYLQCSLWTQASRCLCGLAGKPLQMRKRTQCPMLMYVNYCVICTLTWIIYVNRTTWRTLITLWCQLPASNLDLVVMMHLIRPFKQMDPQCQKWSYGFDCVLSALETNKFLRIAIVLFSQCNIHTLVYNHCFINQ